jgi:hypothetical protein
MPLKKSQRSLKDWGKQKWRTSSGKPSKGKRRYLPDAAWKSLTKSEKAVPRVYQNKRTAEPKGSANVIN